VQCIHQPRLFRPLREDGTQVWEGQGDRRLFLHQTI
jgi:hypothetical protein